jgi:hypothetical protein
VVFSRKENIHFATDGSDVGRLTLVNREQHFFIAKHLVTAFNGANAAAQVVRLAMHANENGVGPGGEKSECQKARE